MNNNNNINRNNNENISEREDDVIDNEDDVHVRIKCSEWYYLENVMYDKNGFNTTEHMMKLLNFNNVKLTVYCTVGDGNCLFRGFSTGLVESRISIDDHKECRRKCCDWLAANGDFIVPGNGSKIKDFLFGEDLGEHVARMRRLTVYGDHLEIVALTEVYGIKIRVIRSNGRTSRISPINLVHHRVTINLYLFAEKEHYQALKITLFNITGRKRYRDFGPKYEKLLKKNKFNNTFLSELKNNPMYSHCCCCYSPVGSNPIEICLLCQLPVHENEKCCLSVQGEGVSGRLVTVCWPCIAQRKELAECEICNETIQNKAEFDVCACQTNQKIHTFHKNCNTKLINQKKITHCWCETKYKDGDD